VRSAFGLFLLLAGLVAVDRVTKIVMMARPLSRGPFLFPDVFEFTRHQNFGIIANIPLPLFLIIACSAVILVLVAFGFVRAVRRRELREAIALTFILAGAIGNLWDRLQWQFVYDWILLFGRSAINLADIMIGIGIVWYLIDRDRDARNEGPPATWEPRKDGATR